MPKEILRIFWPDQIMNKEPWKRSKQPRIEFQIRKRKWGWLGHYTAKTVRRHSQASPRMEPPKQTGQGKTEEYMA